MTAPRKVNILLVDDHPAKLLAYEVILSQLGENLIKADSARSALEQLLKNEIAVILIDVCMPELDGFELATIIRGHPRYQQTAIIFVSAVQIDDPDRLRGYEAGAVDYVSVPVVPEVLRAKVRVFADLYRKSRQLHELNEQLERRVAERTTALEASAEQLRKLNAELELRVEARTRERENAIAQLFEVQKMETVGQLTGGVAHDFNNLLMAILGSLHLLKKRLPDDPRAVRLLDNALQGAERGAALTQRLLAFARRQELKPVSIDIMKLVGGMRELLTRALGHGIEIEISIPDDLNPVQADANQLEMALLNLAINARDAMPDGGKLAITARNAVGRSDEAPAGLQPGDYVCIGLADTGVGMDEATLAKSTEPFFTTKGPGKGTGLGLSMVQGLAVQSGGTLQLRSIPGKGTTASLWLPRAERVEAVTPVVSAVVVDDNLGRACTVLLVDDDALVRMGTTAMLEDMGHTVIEAASGGRAIELLHQNPSIELVITDHLMPGMTGLALASKIRKDFTSLPVILATGFAEAPKDAGGMLGLPRLSKPFLQSDLAATIVEVMNRRSDSMLPSSLEAQRR